MTRPLPRTQGAPVSFLFRSTRILFLVLLLSVAISNRAEAVAQPGDILVADGTLMFAVNPATGARTILTDFSNATQGPTGSSFRVATGPGGVIYVTDGASDQKSKLFRVFADGTRTVVSDATNASQGLPWHTTDTPAVDIDGTILVSDRGFGGGGNDAGLWRVDPATGLRTKLTDVDGHWQGITLDSTNRILLGNAEGGTDCHTFGGCGALYGVDRTTGALTPLADFGNVSQGPLGEDAGYALAKDTDGTILVSDPFAPPCVSSCGVLFRWNPATGNHTYVTKLDDATQGVGGFRVEGVAVAANGTIYISACNGTGGRLAICTVNPTTGARTVFSDFGNAAQGPLGFGIGSLAILQASSGGGTQLTALSPAHVFLGLKNSDDIGGLVDVKVEAKKNGATVASGLTRCFAGIVRDPAKAKEIVVPFDPFSAVSVSTGDELALTVSARIGTKPDDTKCPGGHNALVGLRLYYDSATHSSRFDATISPDPSKDYYLRSNGGACPNGGTDSPGVTTRSLSTTAPGVAPDKCKDSPSLNFNLGNAFREIGTWSVILP